MRAPALLFALATASALEAQQVADSAFTFPNPEPAFESEAGPLVCVDAAHHNFHTLDGRYYTFGKLLRGDGFRTVSVSERFDEAALDECGVIVIANAIGADNAEDWGFPHPSAFAGDEIISLLAWVRNGGNLLLIMDHAPMPGAAADLSSLLGVVPLDGGAMYRVFGGVDEVALREAAEAADTTPERLREMLGSPGALGDHPILRGREGVDEPIRSLMTFGGSAFLPSENVQPLLRLAPGAFGVAYWEAIPEEAWPRYPMDGWLAGGALRYGEGRVVILGEAAMCSAQLAGPDRHPMGMNHPLSVDNPGFCLNTVRWLAGVI